MKENTMDLSVKVSQVSRWDLDYYRWLRYPNDNVVFPCHFILPSIADAVVFSVAEKKTKPPK